MTLIRRTAVGQLGWCTPPVLCLTVGLLVCAACEQRSAHPLAPGAADSGSAQQSLTPSVTSNAAAGASAINVLHGTIVYVTPLFEEWELPALDLKGTNGFRLEGVTVQDQNATGTFFSPHCLNVVGCAPGGTIPFSVTWSGSDFFADVRVRGTTFEGIGSQVSEATLIMQVSGALTFPPAGTEMATATESAPFVLTGTLQLPGDEFTLSGHGRATFSLEWSAVDGTWYVVGVELQFTPSEH